eukprot:s5702_g1.t1
MTPYMFFWLRNIEPVEKSALQYLAEAPEATQLASLLTSNGFRAGRKATKRYYEKIFNGQLRYVVASATQ